MTLADVFLLGRNWLPWAIAAAVAGFVLIVVSYRSAFMTPWARWLAAGLKAAGLAALAMCLVEPLWTGERARPGSNLFLVVADNSRSLQLADGGSQTRGQVVAKTLADESPWLTRLAQDFDVRRYEFDGTPRPVKGFSGLKFDGTSSAIQGSMRQLAERFRKEPLAGVLLLTDGNATDLAEGAVDWKGLPPIFPVAIGDEKNPVDLAVSRIAVSQTNFDAAPVTITADIDSSGLAGRSIVTRLRDESGKEVERRAAPAPDDGHIAHRFLIKPDRYGILFYTVETFLEGEEPKTGSPARTIEATLANNKRLAVVDRGGGPYRILYVSGRPNWEFKFLRRALATDEELALVGLVRIAKKEPKFAFLGRNGEQSNPLFRGFTNQEEEETERYDAPVLIRLTDNKTTDIEELRSGFPKTVDGLFRYHAVILDDIEAAFFTADQLSLLQQFVSQRGGGLLMLGGKDSFADGGYSRTRIAEMLPIYLDRNTTTAAEGYKLKLTREGWLQPWVRVRATEPEEEQRIAAMPEFKTANFADSIKPGATVLSELESADGRTQPALVVQPFGRGRTSAMLVGDLWRWELRRPDHTVSDLEKSWRQTVRWLVSDVPQPVEIEVRPVPGSADALELVVKVRDKLFEPVDNATVRVTVQTPDDRKIELAATASNQTAGEYVAAYTPKTPGGYRATAVATAADGSEAGHRETGWAVEPDTEEFRCLHVNSPLLDQVAAETEGEVLKPADLEGFVADLPNRKAPITETWSYPLWHQWQVLTVVLACLVGEWGLRRWKGLP